MAESYPPEAREGKRGMIYICTWSTKKAEGTIEVDGRNVTEAKRKARQLLEDGYTIKARITKVEHWR